MHYRPWRYWQAMVTAMEYGVTHKLLLASDFPSGTMDNVIDGLRAVNDPVEGTACPTSRRDPGPDHPRELEALLPGLGRGLGGGMSHVMTVRGPVDPAAIGPTMTHEHVFWTAAQLDPSDLPDPAIGELPMSPELRATARWNGSAIRDDLCQDAEADYDLVVEEVHCPGGRRLLPGRDDQQGISPAREAMRRSGRGPDLHVVRARRLRQARTRLGRRRSGGGLEAHPGRGHRGPRRTDVRPGLIGELGTSTELLPARSACCAPARASRADGPADQHPLRPAAAGVVLQILDVLESEGPTCGGSRCRTSTRSPTRLPRGGAEARGHRRVRLLRPRGGYFSPKWSRSATWKMTTLVELVRRGWEDQLVLSRTCKKHYLTASAAWVRPRPAPHRAAAAGQLRRHRGAAGEAAGDDAPPPADHRPAGLAGAGGSRVRSPRATWRRQKSPPHRPRPRDRESPALCAARQPNDEEEERARVLAAPAPPARHRGRARLGAAAAAERHRPGARPRRGPRAGSSDGHLDASTTPLVSRPARAVDRGRPAVRRHRHARRRGLHGRCHRGGGAAGPPPGDLVFLASMHHDTIGLGVKFALASEHDYPRFGICGQPTQLAIHTANGGAIKFRFHLEGRLAHVSRLDEGIDALAAAIDLCVALRGLDLTHEPDARLPDLPLLHVGRVNGGLAGGAVADDVVIAGDIRTVPTMTRETVRADLERLARATIPADVQWSLDLTAVQRPYWARSTARWWTPSPPRTRRCSAARRTSPRACRSRRSSRTPPTCRRSGWRA